VACCGDSGNSSGGRGSNNSWLGRRRGVGWRSLGSLAPHIHGANTSSQALSLAVLERWGAAAIRKASGRSHGQAANTEAAKNSGRGSINFAALGTDHLAMSWHFCLRRVYVLLSGELAFPTNLEKIEDTDRAEYGAFTP
jgi:hypothetical protein